MQLENIPRSDLRRIWQELVKRPDAVDIVADLIGVTANAHPVLAAEQLIPLVANIAQASINQLWEEKAQASAAVVDQMMLQALVKELKRKPGDRMTSTEIAVRIRVCRALYPDGRLVGFSSCGYSRDAMKELRAELKIPEVRAEYGPGGKSWGWVCQYGHEKFMRGVYEELDLQTKGGG